MLANLGLDRYGVTEKQSNWLTAIFLPKRSPNLNPCRNKNKQKPEEGCMCKP